MTRWTRWIPAVAVLVLLAACGSDSSDNPLAPRGASYSGGYSPGANKSDSTTVAESSGESGGTLAEDGTAQTDSTTRTGGYSPGAN